MRPDIIASGGLDVLNYTYIDPVSEIIECLHKGYCDLLAASHQSWRVNVSPPGLLLWGDSAQMKTVYDFIIKRAMVEGEQGSEIALTVMERGNMDECSVWCSRWRLDADLLENPMELSNSIYNSFSGSDARVDMRFCRQVIEQHGGHIWIESAPNGWAKVIFVLPKRNLEFS